MKRTAFAEDRLCSTGCVEDGLCIEHILYWTGCADDRLCIEQVV